MEKKNVFRRIVEDISDEDHEKMTRVVMWSCFSLWLFATLWCMAIRHGI